MTARPSAGATPAAAACTGTAAARRRLGLRIARPGHPRPGWRPARRRRLPMSNPPAATKTPRVRQGASPSWRPSSRWTGATRPPSCCRTTGWGTGARPSSSSTSCASSWGPGAGSGRGALPASGRWSGPPSRTRWARPRRPWRPCCDGCGTARPWTGASRRPTRGSGRGPRGSAKTAAPSASRACSSSSTGWSRWPRSGSTPRRTRRT
mmetsp:Transcript_96583/g.288330  ORF Transcript_96583/g.288330 Transcript_96583/m.288330 type:complete len:208 (+) Transcript_96583:154-777(+)